MLLLTAQVYPMGKCENGTRCGRSIAYYSKGYGNIGVAEEIIKEEFRHFSRMCEGMKEKIRSDLKAWSEKTGKELSEERYRRFRKLGRWIE